MSYNLTEGTSGYTIGYGAGKFGKSVYGGGASTPMTIPNTDDFTIECWLLPTASSGFQIAYGKDDQFFMGIRGDGNYSVQYSATAGATAVGSFTVPTDGLFHHVSFNHDHVNGTTLFVDGVLVGSNPAPLKLDLNTSFPLYVLNVRGQNGEYWSGYIDDLVIWNGLKRTANFAVPTVATPNSAINMKALYHFEDDLTDSAYLAGNKIAFTGPTTGLINTASSDFTVAANGALASTITVTPSDGGAGGSFTPASVSLTSAALSATFTYTPVSNGAKTLSITNSGTLTNGSPLTYTAATAASALAITGPLTCRAPADSAPFTVAANGALSGSVIITPTDSAGGVFTPSTITLSQAKASDSFTYVASSAGNKVITITNTGGLTNPPGLAVTANAPKVAIPTASRAGTRVVRIGAGKDYVDLPAFATYLATQNLVTNLESIIAECYEDVGLYNVSLGPANSSDDYYCIVRPVPGYDEASLNPNGPLTYGTDGIQLTLFQSGIKRGISLQSFRIDCPPGVGSNSSCGFEQGAGRAYELVKNRIQSRATQQFLFYFGTDYSSGKMLDNLFVFNSGASSQLYGLYGDVEIRRNTFVFLGAQGGSLFTKNGSVANSYIQDNAIINGGAVPFVVPVEIATRCSNNFTNQALSAPINGVTSNTTVPFVVDAALDFRPASGSPLLGAGSSSSISVNDINVRNRGLSPDVGAFERVAATPLPVAQVTSQPTPDGQNVSLTFSTTNTPSSGVAILNPASTNPNGALSNTGVVTLGTNTGTATWTGVQPGNYSPYVTVSNSGGAGTLTGATGVSIAGISGTPAAASAPTGPATTLSATGPASGVSGVQSSDFSLFVDGSLSANVTVTLVSSVAGDTITPSTVVLTSASPFGSFKLTPSADGTRTITLTNDGGLTNQAPLSYTSAAVSTVTNVTISPTTATDSQQFTATVVGTNGPSQAVTYTASGGAISPAGLFTAPARTNAVQTITVTARSTQNSDKAATATVTIPVIPVALRTITLTVTDINDAPLINVVNLRCAVFAELTPDLYNAPIYKTSGYSTDSAGVLTFSFSTALVAGTIVGLDISDSNGSPTQSPVSIGFTGPVVLS